MLYTLGQVAEFNLNDIFATPYSLKGLFLNDTISYQLPINNNFNLFFNPYIINPVFQANNQKTIMPEKEVAKTYKSQKKAEGLKKNNKYKKIFDVYISDSSTNNQEDSKELNFITENDITKFNNDQKLKKIHTAYLLKRKVSTKFQKQIKVHANNLIKECNKNNPNIKIPLLYSCTKIFREDVKIDTFQKIKNYTIEKFINEDIQKEGRSLNMKNCKIIELIKDIAEKNADNIYIKKLSDFLFKTIVIDYYNDFLASNNFKSYLKKDLHKYIRKLKSLNYSENIIQIYKIIFKQKYEGIAKYLFDNNNTKII
jgi:hypothetical protein